MKTRLRNNQLLRISFAGLLLGLLIFLFLGPPTSDDTAKRIVITGGDLEQLRISWFRRWQRNPTQQEMQGLLQRYVREEVLYREALARGYDKDDPLVRRAMQQKMEFLGQSQAQTDTINDEQIEAFFALRREQYRVPAVISFVHIFFNVDKRGATAEADARSAIAALREAGPEDSAISSYGDRFLLQSRYHQQTAREVRSAFGEEFTSAILELKADRWEGPIRSGYGLHLVYLYQRENSYIPAWELLKPKTLEDMEMEARTAARELFYTEILRTYQIIFRGEALNVVEGGTGE